MTRIPNTVARTGLLAVTLLLAMPVAAAPEPVTGLALDTSRLFGYFIGDRVQNTVTIQVKKPFTLRTGLLPKPGPVNTWLDIVRIGLREDHTDTQNRYRISVTYQIFKGIKQTESLTIPGLPLSFHDGARVIETRSPPWNVNLSPLIPSRLRDDEVTLRPALEPGAPSPANRVRLLILSGAATAAVLLYLLWWYGRIPLTPRYASPFGRACRNLHRLGRRPVDELVYRQALMAIHDAINQTMSETVLAEDLPRFLRKHPSFQPLEPQIETFFKISRQIFFGEPAAGLRQRYPLAWLRGLCRQCRRSEREIL